MSGCDKSSIRTPWKVATSVTRRAVNTQKKVLTGTHLGSCMWGQGFWGVAGGPSGEPHPALGPVNWQQSTEVLPVDGRQVAWDGQEGSLHASRSAVALRPDWYCCASGPQSAMGCHRAPQGGQLSCVHHTQPCTAWRVSLPALDYASQSPGRHPQLAHGPQHHEHCGTNAGSKL